MKHTVKLLALILAITLVLGCLPVLATDGADLAAAEHLHALGLLQGYGTDANGNVDYRLERIPNRAEALVMLIRLLGEEEAALACTEPTPFTDMETHWAKPYVAYAYAKGYTNGTSATTFSPAREAEARMYLTFVLRALGYRDGEDFQYKTAWEKTDALGVTAGEYNAGNNKAFDRGDMVIVSDRALEAKYKGETYTLLEKLVMTGAVMIPERDTSDSSLTQIENELVHLAAINGNTVPFISCDDNGVPNFIDGQFSDTKVTDANSAISSLEDISHIMQFDNPSKEFSEVYSTSIEMANKASVYRLQQIFNGIPVYGYQLVISTDSNGEITSLTGHYVPGINIDATPIISESSAASIVGSGGKSEGLHIYMLDGETPVLCWLVTTLTEKYFIDASSGEVLSKKKSVIEETVKGTGDKYVRRDGTLQTESVSFNVNVESGQYYLYDSVRNVRVADANHANAEGTPISETSNTNWSAYPEAITVYTNAIKVYDFYKTTLGRDGADNQHKEIYLALNFNGNKNASTPYSNAFFTGSITDRTFIALGDGNDYFLPLDVLCHEFTHAVTDATWDGEYEGESGALNEAYSDIIGDLFEDGQLELHGEDLRAGANRSFANPASKNQPAHYDNKMTCSKSGHHSCSCGDSLDHECDHEYVHYNSGIINHAAYLMDQNWPTSNHANELALLFYNSMEHLTPNSNFLDCRNAVLLASKEMNMSAEKRNVIATAFSDVGVEHKNDEFWASAHHIKGNVRDAETGNPIIDAKVFAFSTEGLGGGIGYTNGSGNFDVRVNRAKYKVAVFADGYLHWEADNVDLTSFFEMDQDLGTIYLSTMQSVFRTDDSWKKHKYEVFSGEANSWDEAQSFCESIGGHLATISSQEENDHVYTIVRNAGYTSAYFGLTDKNIEGTWVWVNGEKVSYTNWHSGEPNHENSNEDYAMFYFKFSDGTWNDGDFGGRTVSGGIAFICEWDTEEAYNAYRLEKEKPIPNYVEHYKQLLQSYPESTSHSYIFNGKRTTYSIDTQYALYDIDKNGTPELIVRKDSTEYYIHTFDGNSTVLCKRGNSEYHSWLYSDCLYEYAGNGLVVHDGGWGYLHLEYAYLYSLSDSYSMEMSTIIGTEENTYNELMDFLGKCTPIRDFIVITDLSKLS